MVVGFAMSAYNCEIWHSNQSEERLIRSFSPQPIAKKSCERAYATRHKHVASIREVDKIDLLPSRHMRGNVEILESNWHQH